MADEENENYELISRKNISKIRKDLEELRGTNPAGAGISDLKDSIEKLSYNLENMLSVFEAASEEMKLEDRETEAIAKRIDPLLEKLDMIIDQNKKIAQGIVAVADIVNEMKSGIKPAEMKPFRPPMQKPRPMPEPRPMPQPGFISSTEMSPMGMMPPRQPMPQQQAGMRVAPAPLSHIMQQKEMTSFDLPPLPPGEEIPMPGMAPPKEKKGFLGIKFTK
jgi:uncharacterized phage infection (PIP) family protein YhgE